MIRYLAWALAAVAGTLALAQAGATSPTLVLGSATPVGFGGVRTVAFEASLDFENAVQTGYGLQLVVFQGARLVRYPLAGAAAVGQAAALADGTLETAEVAGVLASGAPAGPDVRIVSLTSRMLRVVLPSDFPPGATTAILAVVLPEHPVLSNPIGFVLP